VSQQQRAAHVRWLQGRDRSVVDHDDPVRRDAPQRAADDLAHLPLVVETRDSDEMITRVRRHDACCPDRR
jgi:hypothetical protein